MNSEHVHALEGLDAYLTTLDPNTLRGEIILVENKLFPALEKLLEYQNKREPNSVSNSHLGEPYDNLLRKRHSYTESFRKAIVNHAQTIRDMLAGYKEDQESIAFDKLFSTKLGNMTGYEFARYLKYLKNDGTL